ncbi:MULTISPECIES: GNAT family N-acetyltransferase [unclassified Lysobacter]|uniref:GNAT family N-acetyltransferase n=1 Tax=unclassified Lysobacter TaxID=2635362 RepID=UPI0006FE0BD4|nr:MULTISPECIES: GNAT family N-acetyltransferase [unclassified Lysobacter]KQZ67775.1 GNAT family acetyltransferase [Lysobacter sp. Root559]KRC38102.1 GNAT family acetyltransferase [Lysobacter sp. Root76]KRD69427.1 GNAT family acetyltransferase [Lysobacter sp. Root96]
MNLPTNAAQVRCVRDDDFAAWLPLWTAYNAFYGRAGESALPMPITRAVWRRFLDPDEPVFALVAEAQGRLLGLSHYLFHRSTTQLEPVCYLRDLYVVESERGRGIGKALIRSVRRESEAAGAKGVYWQTHATNVAGRRLYDKVAVNEGFIVYDYADRE